MKTSDLLEAINSRVLLSPSAESSLRKYLSSLDGVVLEDDMKRRYKYILYFNNGNKSVVYDEDVELSYLVQKGLITEDEYDRCMDLEIKTI